MKFLKRLRMAFLIWKDSRLWTVYPYTFRRSWYVAGRYVK